MVVNVMDDALHDFIKSINLNDTALVLVSDHGIHMGFLWSFGFPSTKLENKRPGWFMSIPSWWLDMRKESREILKY